MIQLSLDEMELPQLAFGCGGLLSLHTRPWLLCLDRLVAFDFLMAFFLLFLFFYVTDAADVSPAILVSPLVWESGRVLPLRDTRKCVAAAVAQLTTTTIMILDGSGDDNIIITPQPLFFGEVVGGATRTNVGRVRSGGNIWVFCKRSEVICRRVQV
jgi:hypothetical protein